MTKIPLLCFETHSLRNNLINPLSLASEYTWGRKMSPCHGPQVYSGAECAFLVFLSVKSMWSGNHGGSLVFADKSLFFF